MAKQLNINLAFTADTGRAKAQLQDLQSQLTRLINQPTSAFGNKIAEDIEKASLAAAQLKVHLENATNVDTGTLDFAKLDKSLKKSGVTLETYASQIRDMGPEGAKSFMMLAEAVASAEVPIKRSNALLTEMWTTMKNTARWQISSSILHGFMGALQTAYGYSQDLNESLNNIRIVTGNSVDEMAQFAAQANKAAKALSSTTTEYTNAALIYYQQGLQDSEIEARTETTLKMANVSRQSAEIVSDQMTAIWNNFYDGSQSIEYYADVITALGAATASSTDEIAEGLEKFAAVSETVGLSYEYATAALATVTATTRQSADIVGNAFKTLFARIQGLNLGETLDDGTTLNKYSQALEAVGISIFESNGQIKEMDDILDEMGSKWGTLNKAQQTALAQTVAGVRQYTQLIALMDNWEDFQTNLGTASTATGALEEQQKIYEESWEAASDRVRAAFEGIYDTLINDEFFIDLLNVVEKLVGGLDNLIDRAGGLKGVMTGLGLVFTRTFSTQLSETVSDLAYNLSGDKGREKFIDEKIKTFQQLLDLTYDVDNETDTLVEETTKNVLKAQLESQYELIQNAKNLTEEEQKIYQYLLDQKKVRGDLAIETSKKKVQAEIDLEDAKQKFDLELPDNITDLNFEDFELEMTRLAKEYAKIKLNKNATNIDIQKAKENYENAIKDLTNYSHTNLDTVREYANAIFKDETLKLQLDSLLSDLEMKFPDFKEQINQIREAQRKANEEAKDGEKSYGFLLDKLDPQDLVKTAEVLSQVGFGVSSIKSAFDTLKDENLSPLEKMEQMSISLSMGLPALWGGLKKLSATSLGGAIANTKLAGSFDKLAAKIGFAKFTLAGFLGVIATAIAVITALSIAIKRSYDEFNKDAIQAKKAAEAVEQFTESTNKAKESLDQLKDGLNNYEEFQIALNGLNEGTKEWNETLQESNEKILELIEKYPELSKYFESDGSRYSFSEGYQDVLSDLENNYIRLSNGLNLSKMSSIAATNQNLQTEFLRNDDTSSYLNQNLLNIIKDAYDADPASINDLNNVLGDQGIAQSVIDSIATNTEALEDLFDELNTNTAQMKVLAEINSKNINADNEEYNNLSSKDQSLLDSIIANRVANNVSEEDISKRAKELGRTSEYYQKYLESVYGEEANQYRILAGPSGKNTLQKLNDYGTYDTIGEKNSLNSDYILDYLARESFTKASEDDFKQLETLQITGNLLEDLGINENSILQIQKELAEGIIPDLSLLTQEQIDKIKNNPKVDDNIITGANQWNETDHENALNKYKSQQIEGIFNVGEKELEYPKEALESYTESLIENNETLKDNEVEAAKVSVAHIKLGKGLNKVQDVLKNNADAFAEADEESLNYHKAIGELGKALTDAFGFEVDTEFVKEHLSEIQAAANGGAKEIQYLQNLLNEDFIMKLNIKGNKEVLIQELEELSNLALDNTISTDLKIDNQNAIAAINEALVTGEATIEDIEKMFNNANLQMPEYKTIEVPGDAVTSESETTFEGPLGLKYTARSTSVTRTNKVIPYFGDTPPSQSQDKETGKVTWNYGGLSEGQAKSGGLKVDTLNNADTLKNALDFNEDDGKGNKSKKDLKSIDDEIDRYHEIKEVLEDLDRSYNNISKQKDRAFGNNKIKLINEEISALEDLTDAQKVYLNEIEEKLKSDQLNIEKYGAIIQDGKIINYDEIFQAELDKYNTAVLNYNKTGNETKFEASEKRYEDFKKALSLYEETSDLFESETDKLNDFINEIQDKNYEKLEYELELKVEINEADLKRLDFSLERYSNDFYMMAQSAALMLSQGENYVKGLQNYAVLDGEGNLINGQAAQWKQKYEDGKISQEAYINGMKNVRDRIYDQLKALNDLDKEMRHYYEDTLSAANEELSDYIDHMEYLNSVFDHYINLMDILGKSKDYEAIGNFLSGKAQTSRDRLDVAQSNLDMLEGQKASIKESLDAAIKSGDEEAIDYWTDQWDYIVDATDAAQEEVLSLTEQWAEDMKAVIQNNLTSLAEELEKSLTEGMGFERLMDNFDKLNQRQEEYLTRTNQIYETNKLMRTANKALDETDNKVAKQKLKNFVNETKNLQENTKLSKYELEIQQAKYDLLLAEIALEEAQNAKSTVRLTRDSEGNFGYVYTADQDKVDDARQSYEDADNRLYNISLEGQQKYTEQYLQSQQEMFDQLAELQENYLNGEITTEEEYKARQQEIIAHYYGENGILTTYSNLYNVAVRTDADATADNWQKNYGDMTQDTEKWKDNVNDYLKEVEKEFSTWKDVSAQANEDVEGALDKSKKATENLTDESKKLKDTIIDDIIPAIDEELDAVKLQIEAYDKVRESIEAMTDAYLRYLEVIDKEIKDTSTSYDKNIDYTALAIGYLRKVGDSEDSVFKDIIAQRDAKITGEGLNYKKGKDAIDQIIAEAESSKNVGKYEDEDYIDKLLSDLGIIQTFASGGYTGDWGPEGKLAILHEKELVLNEYDTNNLLNTVSLIKEIVGMIDSQASFAALSNLRASFGADMLNQKLEQEVNIHAEFPNATDRYEIEEAFNSLVNKAAQFANRY